MQRKKNSYSNRNKITMQGVLFVEEGSLAENVQNLFLLIQQVGIVFNISISRGAVFLMR